MEISITDNLKNRISFLSIVTFIAVLLAPLNGHPQSVNNPGPKDDLKDNQVDKNAPIHIVSDQMIADTTKRIIDFNGSVEMTQSDSVLTSDKLKIYYKEGGFQGNTEGSGEESISKIIATGNVVINLDNRVAVAEHAVYTTKDGILVLTGKNATITSNKNSITGEKITLYRNEGRIFVESNSKERVRAVLENKKEDSVSTN